MKIKVIGSHLCPDTLYALNKLIENKMDVDFKNLSASISDLKEYLTVRESNDIYINVRKNGGVGIPFFELEDGSTTLDLDKILQLK